MKWILLARENLGRPSYLDYRRGVAQKSISLAPGSLLVKTRAHLLQSSAWYAAKGAAEVRIDRLVEKRRGKMRKLDTVAILGVGLIGGSIGLALRHRNLARCVVGVGRSPVSLRLARRVGAVSTTTTDIARGVAEAELVVVCTPVDRIVDHVLDVAQACRRDALVTDVGSTKSEIVASLKGRLPNSVRFIGSHPLAGGERAGVGSASVDLFENRLVVVTPTRESKKLDCQTLAEFWTALGANVVSMTPRKHDQSVASISHLPHLLASALAAATPEKSLSLAATGFQDTTRVAAGDPDLWTQIFLSNQAPVLEALGRLEISLGRFRTAIDNRDTRALKRMLTTAKRKRDVVGS